MKISAADLIEWGIKKQGENGLIALGAFMALWPNDSVEHTTVLDSMRNRDDVPSCWIDWLEKKVEEHDIPPLPWITLYCDDSLYYVVDRTGPRRPTPAEFYIDIEGCFHHNGTYSFDGKFVSGKRWILKPLVKPDDNLTCGNNTYSIVEDKPRLPLSNEYWWDQDEKTVKYGTDTQERWIMAIARQKIFIKRYKISGNQYYIYKTRPELGNWMQKDGTFDYAWYDVEVYETLEKALFVVLQRGHLLRDIRIVDEEDNVTELCQKNSK